MEVERADNRVSALKIDRSRTSRPVLLKRYALLILAAAFLIAAALYLAFKPTVVDVAQVREARPGEALTSLSAAGYVTAQRRSIVAPKYAGRLDRVLVEEGDSVKQGQVLAQMDDSDTAVAVQQAQATVFAARAASYARRADRIKAERDLGRSRQLMAGQAISVQQLQDATTSYNSSRANERAATAHLAESEKALDAAKLRLDAMIIRSPFAGTVVKKLADEGSVLAPAALDQPDVGGIVELVDLDSLEVDAEVSETELSKIREGQPALVFLDAFPNRALRALVRTIRPTIDRSKATAVVKVELADKPGSLGLLPDMGAKISFLKRTPSKNFENEARLRVPATSVVKRNGKDMVFVIEGKRAREQSVQVEGSVGNEIALASGPKPGTQIVAAPGTKLKDGARIAPKREESRSAVRLPQKQLERREKEFFGNMFAALTPFVARSTALSPVNDDINLPVLQISPNAKRQ